MAGTVPGIDVGISPFQPVFRQLFRQRAINLLARDTLARGVLPVISRQGFPVPVIHTMKKWGLRLLFGRAVALPLIRSATGRTLLPGRDPTFFVREPQRCPAESGRQPLDDANGSALRCGVRPWRSLPLVSDRQRSFNWQSTAFVMRGLWVRFPPLASPVPGPLSMFGTRLGFPPSPAVAHRRKVIKPDARLSLLFSHHG